MIVSQTDGKPYWKWNDRSAEAMKNERVCFSKFCHHQNANSFDMVRCCALVSESYKARLFRES